MWQTQTRPFITKPKQNHRGGSMEGGVKQRNWADRGKGTLKEDGQPGFPRQELSPFRANF